METLFMQLRKISSYRLLLAFVLFLSLPAFAGPNTERGVMIREGVIYISPDTSSAKISDIGRGREVAVIERTPGWVNVVGTVDVVQGVEYDAEAEDRNVTGWILDKGIITTATPDGDKIIFGEAVDSESRGHEAGRPQRSGTGCHAPVRPSGRVLPAVAAGCRIRLSRRRHPLADRRRRCCQPSFRQTSGPCAARPDRRAADEAGHQEISRHQVGRPRCLSLHQQQAVRRLGSTRPSARRRKPTFT